MSAVTPDSNLRRRVADLERRLDEMAELLLKQTRPDKAVTPLNARLWRCTLNADVSSGTAAADLVTLDGTDTGLDITVSDLIASAEDAKNGAALYCLEQIDLDGTRNFVIMSSPRVKTFCRFTLDAALGSTEASEDATITAQYGPGDDHATTDITVYNVAAASDYIFSGVSGAAGIAFWDHDGAKWWIVQMECPE